MDKLQPIIRQRFWILLGLSLILAFFAFFKNQSAIVAATTAREAALKQTLDGIPKGTEANTNYVESLTKINTAYKAKIDEAVDALFASQIARMTWPDQIAKEIPRDAKGVPLYRDKEKVLSTVATRTYSKIYKEQLIEELWKKAEPVVEMYVPPTSAPGMLGGGNRNAELLRSMQSGAIRRRNPRTSKFLKGQTILYDHPGQPKSTWAQKVYIDRQAVPQKVLPQIPSPDAVWDCQEDIWFTDLIFEAVRKVNKDAENVRTSPVKLISRIELRGGAGAAAAGGMEGDMMGGMEGDMGMEMGGDMGAMGGMGGMGAGMEGLAGAAGGMLAPPPTEFDPAEVFGPEAAAAAGGGMDESMGDMEGGMDMAMGGMGGMGGMGIPQALRWVELADGAKFRQRGFYLSVIIDQQRIPDFLVYLCESAWPTKVLRFQMGPNPYRKDVPSNSGAMGGMPGEMDAYGGGAGGFPGAGGGFSMGRSFGGMADADLGGMMGMGGFGGSSAANRFPGGPPQFAFSNRDPFNGSLNQPDLVQLDIAGIITFYVSAAAAAETTAAEAVDTPSAPGGEEELLKEAAAEAAAAAAQKSSDAPANGAAPADGAAPDPATPAPETTPPATEPPAAETPPPAETTDGALPAAPGT